MVSFVHIADLHASKDRQDPCLQVLDKVLSFIKSKDKTPYLLIAGDFWEAGISVSTTFTLFARKMKEILKYTQVFIIYGTATHDVQSSLDFLKLLGAKVYDSFTFEEFEDFELVAIPEPRKARFQIKSEGSIEETINKEMKNFIETLPAKKKPRICMYHGEILGVKNPNGTVSKSEIALKVSLLKKINADYIACGHIHDDIKVDGVDNCYYPGSCYPKDFGEKHDAGFYYIEVEND